MPRRNPVMHRSDRDADKPSGFLPEGLFSCPAFLPEKTNFAVRKFEYRGYSPSTLPLGGWRCDTGFPATYGRLMAIQDCREHVPALRIGSASAGREGSPAMPLQISCSCTLCDIELSLLSNLADGDGSFSEFKLSLNSDNRLSIPGLLQVLRSSPADSRSDEVLAELLRFRSQRPAFTDAILVLAFVPMLHRTVRRVLAFQPSMAEEDVVQQTLGILLQFLGSDDLQARQSHFAFAISRTVKREAFAWVIR